MIFKIMDFKEIIKAHLDKMSEQDAAFAERYKAEGKTLDKCINYVTSQARKQAKNGCAYVEDAVVFGWAVHYYQEEDKNLDLPKTAPKAKVSVPKVEKAKEESKPKEIKPIKALVKDKKENNKCVQLDLFGEF